VPDPTGLYKVYICRPFINPFFGDVKRKIESSEKLIFALKFRGIPKRIEARFLI
jgi:hypothetical protein